MQMLQSHNGLRVGAHLSKIAFLDFAPVTPGIGLFVICGLRLLGLGRCLELGLLLLLLLRRTLYLELRLLLRLRGGLRHRSRWKGTGIKHLCRLLDCWVSLNGLPVALGALIVTVFVVVSAIPVIAGVTVVAILTVVTVVTVIALDNRLWALYLGCCGQRWVLEHLDRQRGLHRHGDRLGIALRAIPVPRHIGVACLPLAVRWYRYGIGYGLGVALDCDILVWVAAAGNA